MNSSKPFSEEQESTLAQRLEQGELVYFPVCPFTLPEAEDRQFLWQQQLGKIHKNISYNPANEKISGGTWQSSEQMERLAQLLAIFGEHATTWLRQRLPEYSQSLQRDRVSFRPEEEATRPLRHNARNDLLHIDAFPSRPTQGARILRLYVNINATDDRVWMTSYTFAELLQKYGGDFELAQSDVANWGWKFGEQITRLFDPFRSNRSDYDQFMLQFHQYMKTNDQLQERSPRRFWKFPPNSAWLAFTDALSHAEMRGQFALEHSFFVPLNALVYPELAPYNIFRQTRETPRRVA